MSKDTPNKQKNIDDVLLSIDSLLDTATDIQLDGSDVSPAKSSSKTTAKNDKQTGAAKTEKSQKPRPKPNTGTSKKPVQKKHHSETKATLTAPSAAVSLEKQPGKQSMPVAANSKAPKITVKSDESAPQDQAGNNQEAAALKQPAVDKTDTAIKNQDFSAAEKPADKEPLRNINIDDDPSGSLNFTTVDDDLSQAMRELPVLEDIVSAEDLALIGSGKEPPKKILTEAFKRLSLTDKLIEILENQLSDYNISKLEYKYLHELFDELLDKENDKH